MAYEENNPHLNKREEQTSPRLEFGAEFDVNTVKNQTQHQTKRNVTLDPREGYFKK